MLSELAACHHHPCFVICCCFCYFFVFWAVYLYGPSALGAFRAERRALQWTAFCVGCHASTKITLVHLPFLSWWNVVTARWKVFARPRSALDVCACVCVPKSSREHVKKSCRQRMLLLPVGLRELQTERRDELIQWKSGLGRADWYVSRVNISRDICERKDLLISFSYDTFHFLWN